MWLWKVPDLRLDADSCSRLLCSKSSSVGVTLDLLLIRLISKSAFYQLKNISRLLPTSPPASNTAVASAFQSPVQSPVCSAVTLTIHQPYPYASSCLPVEFSIYKTLNAAQLLLTNAENKPSLKLTWLATRLATRKIMRKNINDQLSRLSSSKNTKNLLDAPSELDIQHLLSGWKPLCYFCTNYTK